jgi:hypothetical protein
MKKSIFTLLVFGLIVQTTNSFAQNGRFSVGAELGLPMGDFSDVSSMGFGGSVRYEYPITDNIGLMGTVGYLTFSGKTVDGFDYGNTSMIPIQVGGKYYFTENQNGIYLALNLGVHSTSYDSPDITITDPITGITVTEPGGTISNTDVSYAPEVGYHLPNVDIGLRYQMIATDPSTTSYLGIRLAYVFGERK